MFLQGYDDLALQFHHVDRRQSKPGRTADFSKHERLRVPVPIPRVIVDEHRCHFAVLSFADRSPRLWRPVLRTVQLEKDSSALEPNRDHAALNAVNGLVTDGIPALLGLRGLWIGGAEGDRTPDLCIANAALSQLSYGPGRVGWDGKGKA